MAIHVLLEDRLTFMLLMLSTRGLKYSLSPNMPFSISDMISLNLKEGWTTGSSRSLYGMAVGLGWA